MDAEADWDEPGVAYRVRRQRYDRAPPVSAEPRVVPPSVERERAGRGVVPIPLAPQVLGPTSWVHVNLDSDTETIGSDG